MFISYFSLHGTYNRSTALKFLSRLRRARETIRGLVTSSNIVGVNRYRENARPIFHLRRCTKILLMN